MRYTDERSGMTFSGGHPFAALLVATLENDNQKNQAWCRRLASEGVMAAHPDDGWVDRDENSVAFAYPDFNLWPGAGDTIALGHHDNFRLVKVTCVERRNFAGYKLYTKYHFEEMS